MLQCFLGMFRPIWVIQSQWLKKSPNPLGAFKHVSYCIFYLDDEPHTDKTMVRTKCYLIEESLWELLETLGADKALLMVQLPVTVHYLLRRGETTLAALTHGIGQSIGHVAEKENMSESGSEYIYKVTVIKKNSYNKKQGMKYLQNKALTGVMSGRT